MQRRAFLPLFLLVCYLSTAQPGITGHPRWYVKPAFHQGFILVHRISIGHLVRGYPAIYELNFVKPTLGNKLWHVQNHKPDLGITAQCIDYKNPTQLGYGFAVAPFAEIPFRDEVHRARMVMRLSWGVSFLTRHFDIGSNHKNIAIGSALNAFVQFKWFWHVRLSERLRVEPGFSFTHVSNGKFRNPNLGLNVVALTAALNIEGGKARVEKPLLVDSAVYMHHKNELMFFAAAGLNERITNTELLPVYMAGVSVQRNLNHANKIGFGLDVFYDKNYNVDHELRDSIVLRGLNTLRVAARVGYSYNLGRLSFPIEVGYYIFQRSRPDGEIVSRIGLRYYMPNNLVIHLGLRSHLAVAYNFELGLGYRLPL